MKNSDILKNSKIFLNLIKNKLKKKRGETIHLHQPFIPRDTMVDLNDCIKKNFISSIGPHSILFQKKIKEITESRYVVLTTNGTSALHVALVVSGIKKNQEVLMPSLNYVASAFATLYCKAIPHFIEVSEDNLSIDVIKLENYLKKITVKKKNRLFNKKTKREIKALICLHTFGHPAKIDVLKNICKKYNLFLIEDSAEALGSYYNKQHVGTFGDIGILSFNGNKIVSTGAGGAIITNNKKIFIHASHLVQNSKVNHPYFFNYDELGYNYRMANINSALGLSQLSHLKKIVKKKRWFYEFYSKIFKNINYFYVLKEPKNCKSNYWLQTLILKKPNLKLRNKILEISNKNGIALRPVWSLLHKIKFLNKFPKMNLDISVNLEKKIINLPSSYDLVSNDKF